MSNPRKDRADKGRRKERKQERKQKRFEKDKPKHKVTVYVPPQS